MVASLVIPGLREVPEPQGRGGEGGTGRDRRDLAQPLGRRVGGSGELAQALLLILLDST
jgi:hypothetical protein